MKYSARTCCAIVMLLLPGAMATARVKSPKLDPKADQVLRAMADTLRGLQAFQLTLEMRSKALLEGSRATTSTHFVAVERPNKLIARLEKGDTGFTIVCDGSKLYRYFPIVHNYYDVADAPASLAAIAVSGISGVGLEQLVFGGLLAADDPYAAITKDVKAVRYTGRVDLGGQPCHELVFDHREATWRLWVLDGDRSLPVRLEPDVTMPYGATKVKVETVARLVDWVAGADVPDDTFRFVPPKGARKIEAEPRNPAGGSGPGQELVGRAAPAFTLPLLEGGEMDLAAHRGKHVVILYFWKIKSETSVLGLPALVKIAAARRARGVVLYAINERDEPEQVKKLLDVARLDLRVPLDADGRVRGLYGEGGVPQVVVIGTDGLVEAVHIRGVHGVEEKLGEQLDAILGGKSLAREAQEAMKPRDLERAWSIDGPYVAVAGAGATGFALTAQGECVEVDLAGKIVRRLQLDGQSKGLCAARLAGDARPELVTFGDWGVPLKAYDSDGKPLWTYEVRRDEVADICAADLDGNGTDELIVGYLRGGGLHVVDGRGLTRWKNTDLQIVWHVCAGDLDGDRVPEVVATSAKFDVRVFTAGGRLVKDLDVPGAAMMVRIGTGKGGGQIVSDAAHSMGMLMGHGLDGAERWSILGYAFQSVTSAAATTSKPWVAAAESGGSITVVDIDAGRIVGSVGAQGRDPHVAWIEADRTPPLLLTTNARTLGAYRLADGTPKR